MKEMISEDKRLRTGLLSSKERLIIETFLKEGIKLDGFSVILHRCRNNLEHIEQDLDLIQNFLAKMDNK